LAHCTSFVWKTSRETTAPIPDIAARAEECVSERSTGRNTSPKASFNGSIVTMNVPSLSEQRTPGGDRVISDVLRRRALLQAMIQTHCDSFPQDPPSSNLAVQSSEIAEVKPGPFDGRLLSRVLSGAL
jgi:hypothetical protein